jgi:hypothetical protein
MKKILLIAALCFLPLAAHADDDVIKLPGNAEYRPGNGTVVVESYDTKDIIYRRLINPRYGREYYNYNRYNRLPSNDAASVCGNIERDRKRERCLEDYREERQKLIEKYN